MKLTEHEQHSAVWIKIRDHLTERLDALRSQNDGDLDPLATARLRGRIAAIKELLALGQPTPAVADGAPTDPSSGA